MDENVIAVKKKDVVKIKDAFTELMYRTECSLNSNARINPQEYRKMTASELEMVSTEVIRQSCEGLPFAPEEVYLVSGQRFPDIIAEKCFGVEVKSTTRDHWTSTGGSIVESTRVDSVEDIYMLFGKLGGTPQFRCRPYQDVLYDITVTHSPRYLINMDLSSDSTIFSKMGTSYDEFRTSPNSIERMRMYYREKAKQEGRQEMPWWLTVDNIDEPINMTVRLWNSVSTEERADLMAKGIVLFPETLESKYNQFVLWLCSYRQIVIPNVRDEFSAGGRIKSVNGNMLSQPVAQIFSRIVKYSKRIESLLRNPSREMIMLIKDYNPELLAGGSIYENWLLQCNKIAKQRGVPIMEWIKNNPQFTF